MEYKIHHKLIDFTWGGESSRREQIIEFELEINELIKQGYEPLGGVSTSIVGRVVFVSQSLVKKVISN
jgi:hypothetical protein